MTTGSAIALATERLVEPVEGMHHAIASRGFGLTGPLGRPIHRIHNTVAATVYASIRHGATLIGAIVDGSPLGTQTGSDALVPFVNAVWGDDLGDHEGRLALAMSAITAAGDPVSAGIRDLEATPHLVVLVHGLGQSEASWRTDATPDLVDRLSADPGTTTLLVRYNTGRPIAANGFDLAALVESIALEWPVPVERLTLVGHSLGGLVCRSACVAGQSAGHGWVDLVSEVIATGAPHKGAPAEKAAHVAAWALGIARVTRPLAGFLNRRSRGIKDLRFGTILDSDW